MRCHKISWQGGTLNSGDTPMIRAKPMDEISRSDGRGPPRPTVRRGRLAGKKASLRSQGQQAVEQLFSVIDVGNELLGFGVRVMKIAAAEVSDRVISTRFLFERLVNQPVRREFVPQPSGNVFPGRCDLSVLAAQIERYRLRRHSDICPVKQTEYRIVCARHPRHQRRH
jgi:hypothetical protein